MNVLVNIKNLSVGFYSNQKKQSEELPGRLGNKDLTVNEDKRINVK